MKLSYVLGIFGFCIVTTGCGASRTERVEKTLRALIAEEAVDFIETHKGHVLDRLKGSCVEAQNGAELGFQQMKEEIKKHIEK